MCITTLSFENYVNYAGSKTTSSIFPNAPLFENYVNYAGSKTKPVPHTTPIGLRTM